jgi:Fe2+ transport system protein FeoA
LLGLKLAEASGRLRWAKAGFGGWAQGKSFLQPSLNCHNLAAVKQKPPPAFEVLEGRCAGPEVCPLSRVKAGAVVCIRHLTTAPEVTDRLRELGFCEEQRIKLLTRRSNFICQVCNARLAISEKLADSIMVEAVPTAAPGV